MWNVDHHETLHVVRNGVNVSSGTAAPSSESACCFIRVRDLTLVLISV